MSTVLVTGGTGMLGTRLVPMLRDRGHRVRVLTRRAAADPGTVTADLVRTPDLSEVVAGSDVIVHAATDHAGGSVDRAGTRRLVEAAASAGPPYLLLVSMVGVDRIPLRYYRAKLAAEEAVEGADLPWAILRATQFHHGLSGFLRRSYRWGRTWVPRNLRFQPIDPAAVAGRIAGVLDTRPRGRLPDLGGPEVLPVEDMARSLSAALGRRQALARVPVVGRAWRAVKAGHNLADTREAGSTTWADHVRSLSQT
jgi:uncharacterized protein YbjT (DUF2867 family)